MEAQPGQRAVIRRRLAARIRFRSRTVLGVISTSSSLLMNSIACSRFSTPRRDEPDPLVGCGGSHIRELLLFADVDVYVGRTGVLPDDHPLVDRSFPAR